MRVFIKRHWLLIKARVERREPGAIIIAYLLSATLATALLGILEVQELKNAKITAKQFAKRMSAWSGLWLFCQIAGKVLLVAIILGIAFVIEQVAKAWSLF